MKIITLMVSHHLLMQLALLKRFSLIHVPAQGFEPSGAGRQ